MPARGSATHPTRIGITTSWLLAIRSRRSAPRDRPSRCEETIAFWPITRSPGYILYVFIIDGTNNRWLNNYIHNVLDTYDKHSDVFQAGSSSLGLSYNLFESNFVVGNGTLANEHGVLIRNLTEVSCSTGTCAAIKENLFRRNVWHNISGGVIGVSSPIGRIANTRQVHDTMVSPAPTAPSQTYAISFSGTWCQRLSV